MLSGIGDRSELSKFNISTIVDLGDVGKNLSEHFIFSSQWEVVGTAHTFEDAEQDPAVAAAQLAQWQVNATGPLASGPGNQLGWFHLLSNSSIFTNVTDPSAGPASAHFELLFSVSMRKFICRYLLKRSCKRTDSLALDERLLLRATI